MTEPGFPPSSESAPSAGGAKTGREISLFEWGAPPRPRFVPVTPFSGVRPFPQDWYPVQSALIPFPVLLEWQRAAHASLCDLLEKEAAA